MALYNGHNEDQNGNLLLCIGNGLTASLETGSAATQAYSKGSFLFFNNRLCKALSDIVTDEPLVIGTNIQETSIGAEMTSHLRANNGTEFYFDYQNERYGYNTSPDRGSSTFVPFVADFRMVINVQLKNSQHPHQGTDVSGTGWRTVTIEHINGVTTFEGPNEAVVVASSYGMVGQTGDQTERGCNGYSYLKAIQLVSFEWL